MALGGFLALLFEPPGLKVLAEIEKKILHCLLSPHSPLKAFTPWHYLK